MIYLITFLAVVTVGLLFLTPKSHRVHAAKVKPLPSFVRPISRYAMFGLIATPKGEHIDTNNKMIGVIDGKSCEYVGLLDGSEFIADYLDESGRLNLKRDDVVVVDARTDRSSTGKRLRIVESVNLNDGTVRFRPDAQGDRRRDRPLTEISAKVSYVRESA